jgi:hypothetical protein
MEELERHFAPVEVASLLKVKTRTVLAWLRDPDHPLVGIKISKMWRISESDLRKFLKESREQ